MIISALIYAFKSLFLGLISFLPNGSSLPAQIIDSISFFSSMWNQWGNILPLNDLLIIITLVISIEGYLWLFGFSNFIYKKIRG